MYVENTASKPPQSYPGLKNRKITVIVFKYRPSELLTLTFLQRGLRDAFLQCSKEQNVKKKLDSSNIFMENKVSEDRGRYHYQALEEHALHYAFP